MDSPSVPLSWHTIDNKPCNFTNEVTFPESSSQKVQEVILKPELLLEHCLKQYDEAKIQATEGHCLPGQMRFFLQFLQDHKEIKTVLEIGFNAGHSASAFLNARSDTKVISIDIGDHDYVIKAKKQFIDKYWPKRHLLLIGNSTEVMPLLHTCMESFSPDLIFIDGGHTGQTPYLDILNALEMAKPSTWIIVDDVTKYQPDVVSAVQKVISTLKMCHLFSAKTDSDSTGWVVGKKVF